MKAKILFVDDEEQILLALRALFSSKYQVYLANSGMQALEIIKDNDIDVIVSDQRMPGMLGVDLLKQAKELSPRTVRLLLTGYSDQDSVLGSINEGEVFRFILKPWDNNEIRKILEIAVEKSQTVTTAKETVAFEGKLALLVLDDLNQIVRQLKEIFPKEYDVYHANTFTRAKEILNEYEVGIIIFDVIVDNQDTTDFIKEVKNNSVGIMTMVLTQDIDCEGAIDLVNYGLVYRYLRKPISNALLRVSVSQGIKFYLKSKK